jgi:hypothetical protein
MICASEMEESKTMVPIAGSVFICHSSEVIEYLHFHIRCCHPSKIDIIAACDEER